MSTKSIRSPSLCSGWPYHHQQPECGHNRQRINLGNGKLVVFFNKSIQFGYWIYFWWHDEHRATHVEPGGDSFGSKLRIGGVSGLGPGGFGICFPAEHGRPIGPCNRSPHFAFTPNRLGFWRGVYQHRPVLPIHFNTRCHSIYSQYFGQYHHPAFVFCEYHRI